MTAPDRELLAELAERRMDTGRTQPISVFARGPAPDDVAVPCVIKPRNRLTMPPVEYLCEWVASKIATALGVTTPAPHPVRIDRMFAESVTDAELRSDLLDSVGLVFGSEYVAADYTQHTHDLTLSRAQRLSAASVLGFDIFIHNPDRRAVNHNLFVNRDGFMVFDHEMAFSFLVTVIGAPPPSTDPLLGVVGHHVFRHAFGKSVDFGPFRSALANLSDDALTGIAQATPEEWTGGSAHGKLMKIMEVLGERRDAVDSWLPQVEAAVTA